MSQWVLVCPRCKHKFPHSEISDVAVGETFRNSGGLTARPRLGVDRLVCPSCNAKSWYPDFDLIYSTDDTDTTAKGKGA
jgi:uncharacterized protein YbaR (Trm112 family)